MPYVLKLNLKPHTVLRYREQGSPTDFGCLTKDISAGVNMYFCFAKVHLLKASKTYHHFGKEVSALNLKL